MDRDNTIARLENIAKHAVHTAGEDIFILNLDDGIAIHEAIEALKAQLSHESTTSDTISRQWLLECVDEGWIKFDTEEDANRFIHLVRDIAPTIQTVATDTNVGDNSEITNSSDAVSRQAAIDIERNATVDTNPSHFEAHQKFTQFMDDAEVSSFGRWQWANGFNTALTAVGIDLKKLPTVQPERAEGHWINGKCDRCGEHAPFWCMASTYHESKYCPNCGAKMKGVRQK